MELTNHRVNHNFMIRLLVLLAGTFLVSCNNCQDHNNVVELENEYLHKKLESLKQENASIANELARYKTKPKNKSKRQYKPGGNADKTDGTVSMNAINPIIDDNKKNKSHSSSLATPRTETYSAQCMATTRKGSRCSRSSRSGGYCWQHGG